MALVKRFFAFRQISAKIHWTLLAATGMLAGVWTVSSQPQWVEAYYCRGVYPGITRILSTVFGALPFSFTEIAIYLLVLGFLATAVMMFSGRLNFLLWLEGWLTLLAVLAAWFYLAWGLNYFRSPIAERYRLRLAARDRTLFQRGVRFLIHEANATRPDSLRLQKEKICAEIEAGFRRMALRFSWRLPAGNRRPKQFLFNFWLNRTLTSGFFSPIFHEVHLNAELLPAEYPFALAHEKAHQMGFARESEASIAAFVACMQTGDSLVRYSAYLAALRYARLRARRWLPNPEDLFAELRPEVRQDEKRIRRHWRRYISGISRFSRKTYNRYLQANRIPQGMEDYTGVVDYILFWYYPNFVRGTQ